MLTKTLKFDGDVLATLRAMQWGDGGTIGKIVTQLDRKLYDKTNKALEAMGGKWNRGKGGHVFTSDPRPKVEGLLESGTLSVVRDGFFETPEAVITRMFELAFPFGRVLEPSAGRGAIADQLRSIVPLENITCVERNVERAEFLKNKGYKVVCTDFSTFGCPMDGFDSIFMNPPFEESQDIDHVLYAYDMLRKDGVLVAVMGEGAFFRSDRKATHFRNFLETVRHRIEKLPDNSFKESGTGVAARLLVLWQTPL